MKSEEDLISSLEKVVTQDRRYKLEAYTFVLAALSFTIAKLKRSGHISGGELLDGIKDYAIIQFGRLARMVLEHWGVKETEDFGNIVFNMVNNGLLGKRDEDKIDDFRNKYKFDDVFEKNFKYEI